MNRWNQVETSHVQALKQARRFGYGALVVFAAALAVWSSTTTLSGAVIASGQFVSETDLKKVQHQSGGVVAALHVREGSRVQAGDLLIRLDETIARANLAIASRQINELQARGARLEAERDQTAAIAFPAALTSRADQPEIAALMAAEDHLFAARASARTGIRSQLEKRILQIRSMVSGLQEQKSAKQRESELIARELVGVRTLYQQKLVQITRLSQLEREAAALDGARGQLTAQMAEGQSRIAETELQIIQQAEELRAEALKELREIQGKLGELHEKKIAAEDQLARIEIRAPVSGIVHQLAVHTVGGVISPAEAAMLIVPSEDKLSLDARVAPTEIDQVTLGQAAVVRIQAFNQRTTPELKASVSRIAADVSRDPQSGAVFYLVRLHIPVDEIVRIGPLQVQSGMLAEVFMQTASRSPWQYLIQPLRDQLVRAFRER